MNNAPDLNRKLLTATLLIGFTFTLVLIPPVSASIQYLLNR